MASAAESSLIAKLESSDPREIRNPRFHASLLRFEEKEGGGEAGDDSEEEDGEEQCERSEAIRPLAKQYPQFISRALKILPNRLSNLPQFGGGDDAEAIGSKMFDGRFEEAEVLRFGVLDGLRSAKMKKVEARFVPDLGNLTTS
ncbi:hypothetical protein Scep_026166 [Stephania cephalantha]|uniref:Separase-like TPR repeats region domain-containing protein n=1 Tax=Stephania cephalantha TaxID=152367 RepID=A0AAP0EPW1_9MAGN